MPDPRLEEYRAAHDRCAVCHLHERHGKLDIHHVQNRRRDFNDPRNLIMLCHDVCHYSYHSGSRSLEPLTLGHILLAKEEEDGHVDLAFLASLKGRVGLPEDPTPLPSWALAARIDNRQPGKPKWR